MNPDRGDPCVPVVTCPSCRNDLLAPAAAEPYLRNCPTCGDPVAVPAAGASAAPAAGAPATPGPGVARRPRRPAVRRSHVLIAVGCVGLVAATVGSWLLYERQEKRERANRVLEAQFANNRALVANRELAYWLKKGIPPAHLRALQRTAAELDQAANDRDAELDRRWGADRKGLRELGDDRAGACGECLILSAQGAEARLNENALAMGKELVQLEARIAAELTPVEVEVPVFDRTTENGERQFQEFRAALPAQRERARAECEAARAKRFRTESGPIVEKWVARTRDENRKMLDEFERAVLSRK